MKAAWFYFGEIELRASSSAGQMYGIGA